MVRNRTLKDALYHASQWTCTGGLLTASVSEEPLRRFRCHVERKAAALEISDRLPDQPASRLTQQAKQKVLRANGKSARLHRFVAGEE